MDVPRGESDLERAARERPRPSLIGDFTDFLLHNKKWWLIPFLVILLGLGLIAGLSSGPIAPFLYTLF